MSDLYGDDIVIWSERQAELLRRIAAGEPVNEAPDWPNIAEEIEDVGRSELHSVESLLVQALRHMLKAEAWPLSRDAPNWRADAVDFRRQAHRRFVPSMRRGSMLPGSTPTRSLPSPLRRMACRRCRSRPRFRRWTSC